MKSVKHKTVNPPKIKSKKLKLSSTSQYLHTLGGTFIPNDALNSTKLTEKCTRVLKIFYESAKNCYNSIVMISKSRMELPRNNRNNPTQSLNVRG